MRFCRHAPNLEIRIWISTFHIYLRKWLFWPSKLCCSLFAHEKEFFSSTWNITILQMVRNESVRFGRHVDIEISYKILLLKVLKKFQFCIIYLALNRSYFEMILMKNIPRTLGVEFFRFYKQVIFILHILL
jgi:hypothetical protein